MDSRRMDMSLRKLQEMVRARETWPAAAHGVTKSQTRPSNRTTRKMARWTHLKGRTQRNTCAHGAGEREGRDQLRERWHKGTAVLKQPAGGQLLLTRAQLSALRQPAREGGMPPGRRLSGKGTHAHFQLIHTVQQKPAQHRKAIYPPIKNEL